MERSNQLEDGMDARFRAGIDLYGKTLRYAEVERYDRPGSAGRRLLRLGSCDFDFDVARALWGDSPDAEEELDTFGEALADVYDGSSAQALRVVVHPPRAHSFFAPVPAQTAETARLERFRREAQLLARAGARPAGGGQEAPGLAPLPGSMPLHVSADRLHAAVGSNAGGDGGREWFHVLALDGEAHARFQRVMERLPMARFRWTISMEGAARAAATLRQYRRREEHAGGGAASGKREGAGNASRNAAAFALTVGRYREHLELALVRRGRFWFALHAPRATPADSAYFAAALLERTGVAPAAVERVFVYGFDGAPERFAALGRLTGTRPQPLDFCPVVGLNADRFDTGFEAGPFVPCIGASL